MFSLCEEAKHKSKHCRSAFQPLSLLPNNLKERKREERREGGREGGEKRGKEGRER